MAESEWLEISNGFCILRFDPDLAGELDDLIVHTIDHLFANENLESVVIGLGPRRGILEEDPETEDGKKDWPLLEFP